MALAIDRSRLSRGRLAQAQAAAENASLSVPVNATDVATLPVREKPDIAGSLPFEKVHGGTAVFFGRIEGSHFHMESAHIELYGRGYGTTLRMELGRRTNGNETRFTAQEALSIMGALNLKMEKVETCDPKLSENGDWYIPVKFI